MGKHPEVTFSGAVEVGPICVRSLRQPDANQPARRGPRLTSAGHGRLKSGPPETTEIRAPKAPNLSSSAQQQLPRKPNEADLHWASVPVQHLRRGGPREGSGESPRLKRALPHARRRGGSPVRSAGPWLRAAVNQGAAISVATGMVGARGPRKCTGPGPVEAPVALARTRATVDAPVVGLGDNRMHRGRVWTHPSFHATCDADGPGVLRQTSSVTLGWPGSWSL